MPLLQVIGVPEDARKHLSVTAYRYQELPLAAASIPDMGVTTDLVTVHVPEDDGLNGREIIVLILGLFRKERPKRTDEVVQAFAEALLEPTIAMVRSALPECTKIEVFDPSNIDRCFAEWTIEQDSPAEPPSRENWLSRNEAVRIGVENGIDGQSLGQALGVLFRTSDVPWLRWSEPLNNYEVEINHLVSWLGPDAKHPINRPPRFGESSHERILALHRASLRHS